MNDSPPSFRVMVGLGNPGPEYDGTYHNAGALAVDFWAKEAGVTLKKQGRESWAQAKTGPLLLAKPVAFMNVSGPVVHKLLRAIQAAPADLLLVHDDSDLPLGEWRLVFGRGAAGHHGVESVIAALRTKDFWRLRLGIRHGRGKAGEFVLRKMTAANRKKFYLGLKEATEKVMENTNP